MANNFCHSCNFWMELYERDKTDRYCIVINGTHYVIAEESPTSLSSFRGFGGQRFNIQRLNGEIIHTTNLWSQGRIPYRFLDKFPNNAVFLKEIR